MRKLTTEEFIEKAKEIHGDKFDYSLVDYITARTKVKIICPIHGQFKQTPDCHLRGYNCPKCKLIFISSKFRDTTEEFIEKAKKIHGDKFDYSLVEYINAKSKVKIICKIHGIFEQIPDNHIRKKYGCPICSESLGEREIAKLLTERNIDFIREYKFDDCKNINHLPFDFFIPSIKTAIEFNGIQHYEIDGFINKVQEDLDLRKKLDKIKIDYCYNNKINLIIINDLKLISSFLQNI